MTLHGLIASAALLVSLPASAADWQVMQLADQDSIRYGSFSHDTGTGQVGISLGASCDTSASRRLYLVQQQVYSSRNSNCIGIYINHKPVAADGNDAPTPNWVNVQIIRYYESYSGDAVTIARKGTFRRIDRVLPPLPDEGLTIRNVEIGAFDEAHTYDDKDKPVTVADELLGKPWHGAPDGNDSLMSWMSRDRFRTDTPFSTQLRLKQRSLHTRLIRFTPGDASHGLPLAQISPGEAKAMIVKIYSPYSTNFQRSFVLVFEQDKTRIDQVIAADVAPTACNFFCQLSQIFQNLVQ